MRPASWRALATLIFSINSVAMVSKWAGGRLSLGLATKSMAPQSQRFEGSVSAFLRMGADHDHGQRSAAHNHSQRFPCHPCAGIFQIEGNHVGTKFLNFLERERRRPWRYPRLRSKGRAPGMVGMSFPHECGNHPTTRNSKRVRSCDRSKRNCAREGARELRETFRIKNDGAVTKK